MRKVLANKILEIRKEKGITRKQLAVAIGSKESSVYSLEKGRYKTTKHLKQIAKTLGCKLDDISVYQKNNYGICKEKGCKEKLTKQNQQFCESCALERKRKQCRENARKAKKNESKPDSSGVYKVNIPNYANEEIVTVTTTEKPKFNHVHSIKFDGGVYKGKMPKSHLGETPESKREYNGYYEA